MKLNGHDIAEKIYQTLRERVGELQKKNIIPHLVVILIGESPASLAYVKQKVTKGEEIGCKVTVLRYAPTITTEELEKKIKLLNSDPFVHAILIQRPVPQHVDIDKLESLTDPEKDIDGFHPDSPYTLPLPLAVVKILEEIYTSSLRGGTTKQSPTVIETGGDRHAPNVARDDGFITWLQSQNIVITGKGPTGGGPIIKHLNKLGIHPTLIDSKTPSPKKLLKQADIIIAAVGKENMLTPELLKKGLPAGRQGVILIGVGILRGADGKLHGDYETEQIQDIASYYTPTPGGVGPVNVAMLIDNLVTATEKLLPAYI